MHTPDALEPVPRHGRRDACVEAQAIHLRFAEIALRHATRIGCVQGNLDPLLLVAGGDEMRVQAAHILETLGHGPFIFNLGHGIVPQTPPEHVGELVRLVKDWRG